MVVFELSPEDVLTFEVEDISDTMQSSIALSCRDTVDNSLVLFAVCSNPPFRYSITPDTGLLLMSEPCVMSVTLSNSQLGLVRFLSTVPGDYLVQAKRERNRRVLVESGLLDTTKRLNALVGKTKSPEVHYYAEAASTGSASGSDTEKEAAIMTSTSMARPRRTILTTAKVSMPKQHHLTVAVTLRNKELQSCPQLQWQGHAGQILTTAKVALVVNS
jgi:hypothetical protein